MRLLILLFKKRPILLVFEVAALLHYFGPFVQGCPLVGEHDCCFFLPDRSCIPQILCCRQRLVWYLVYLVILYLVGTRSPPLEFPDVGRQWSVLEFVVPIGWSVKWIISLVGEGPGITRSHISFFSLIRTFLDDSILNNFLHDNISFLVNFFSFQFPVWIC